MEHIQKLDPTEKERYVNWHKGAIKEDLACAEKLQDISPRNAIVLGYNAIVLGYYAMHNCAKKYLGEIHNLKIKKIEGSSSTS